MHPAIERLATFERFGIHLGLERMEAILDALGHPEARGPVVHVAGTNGKGSVAAMLASCLQAAGHRVGLYTSPHLTHKGERVRIDGEPLSEDELGEVLAEEVYPALAAVDPERYGSPTEFEVLTAAGLCAFRRAGTTADVLEAGLGGRLDATNAVARPVACVITAIALDHTERLGTTLAAIATEKAGIAKPGRPLVSAPQPAEAAVAIASRCAALGAPLVLSDRCRLALLTRRPDGQTFRWRQPDGQEAFYDLPLLGEHQLDNAATTLTALEVLAVDTEATQRGLAAVRWPGRLERLAGPGGLWLLDGAHNPAGAAALAAALADHFPGGRFVLLFSALREKDAAAMLAPLLPLAAGLVLARPPGPRARDPEALARLAAGWAGPVEVCQDPGEALAAAAALARSLDPSPTGVVVCGSLYLIGAIRELLVRS